MERYLEFRIDEQTTELKMEAFLKKNAGLTKRQISQAKFRPDGITRNGVRCRVTETIYPGECDLRLSGGSRTASAHLENYNDGIRSKDLSDFHSNRASAPVSETSFSLNILYEDTDILAVDNRQEWLRIRRECIIQTASPILLPVTFERKMNRSVSARWGRLDQETSGIVVFAQNQVAASRLQSVKSPCKIHKQYLAAVSGTLPVDMPGVWHTLDLPLMQDPENHLKMKTAADLSLHSSALSGKIKTAVTHYHTLFSSQDWSLITLKLDTGRTHQIRVHMASTGHPLLGDTLYHSDDKISSCASFSRAALHAWKVSFQHPFRDEMLLLEAPLPSIFVNWFHFQGLICCLFKLQVL